MDTGLTLLGGGGFVGSAWRARQGFSIPSVYVNARDDYHIYTPDVLNLISTVDNYNVLTDSHIDIDTNLTVLVETLDNWRKRLEKYPEETGYYNLCSSWFVYDSANTPPVAEIGTCDLSVDGGFYSITKRTAELLVMSYCRTFGLKYRILRLANVIGPGDTKVSEKKNALQYMVNRIKNHEEVRLYGNGAFYRDYIHKDDCADAIDLILTSAPEGIYNIGNGFPGCTVGQIIEYVKAQTLSKSPVIKVASPVRSFYMDITKLLSYGYKPRYWSFDLYDTLL